MDLVHYKVGVGSQGVRVVDQTLEENTCCHEKHFGHIASLARLHAHMVTNGLAHFLVQFLSYPLRNTYGG